MSIPYPPESVKGCSRVVICKRADPWWRIQDQQFGVEICFGRRGLGRWSDPQQIFGVCYMAGGLSAAFAETFGHGLVERQVPAAPKFVGIDELKVKKVLQVVPRRKLKLVDLQGAGLPSLNLDARIFSTTDYGVSQAWARWLHGRPIALDGILYRSRHLPDHLCAALFDRCEDTLEVLDEGSMLDHPQLLDILDQQGWALI